MACAYKYMCAFDAVVLPVMAEYSSDITRIFSVLPRMSNLQDEVAFISRSDEFKKMLILMVVIGYTHRRIADVLIAEPATIRTLKCELKNEIDYITMRMLELNLAA